MKKILQEFADVVQSYFFLLVQAYSLVITSVIVQATQVKLSAVSGWYRNVSRLDKWWPHLA